MLMMFAVSPTLAVSTEEYDLRAAHICFFLSQRWGRRGQGQLADYRCCQPQTPNPTETQHDFAGRAQRRNTKQDKTILAIGGLLEGLYVCLRFRDITPNNGESHGKEHGQ